MTIDSQKQHFQGIFSRSAASYGQIGPPFFQNFGRRLVAFAQVPPGARVLDVACGRGAVLFPLAEAVGPTGQVTGVDYAPAMVAETGREIAARAVANAGVLQMDAEHLQFPDACFDYVLCGFAIFFFPQLNQALAEMRRVLVPGGQVVISTWGQYDERWAWLDNLLKQYLPPEPGPADAPPDQSAPEPDFNTPAGVQAILEGGGFRFLRAKVEAEMIAFRSEAEWWSASWSHGGRGPLEEIERRSGSKGLEAYQADAFAHLQAIKTADGFPERLEAVLAAGQKVD